MRKLFCSIILMLAIVQMAMAGTGIVQVRLTGAKDGNKVTLTLESSSYIDVIVATADGDYQFDGVPSGKYNVKVEAPGYNLPQAQTVIVNDDGSVAPKEPLKVAVTRMSDNPDEWNFSWQEDFSTGGYTTSAHVNTPSEVEFLGKKIVPADVPSFAQLSNDYKIMLADDEEPWTQEYAYRLVETLKTIPFSYPPLAKFSLTAESLGDDIEIKNLGDGLEVRISKDAFYYANPFLVSLDGVRGRFFSKRLHHAMVNYVTDFGRNTGRANEILYTRFGCKVLDVNYEELTRGITNEDAGRFQNFVPSELVSIINMFEELPEGFHKTPHLNYLIRRINGMPHPIYPDAAAVSWCVDNGYIEFMESAFGGNNEQSETLRLILHEKTHFLWAYAFSDEIRNDWADVGGWYPDPNAEDGWSTTKNTEFVSQYAHAKNPNEDMAESVAYYLKDPDKLMSRSPEKYEFIRDRIMHGVRYVSKIPDHLTFEVLNLFPDYDYPGKIKRVDVKVVGAPEEDKRLTVEIELNDMDGYDDGAASAYVRVSSSRYIDQLGETVYHFRDVWMYQVDGNDHLLRGEVTISKYCKSGYWAAGDISVNDAAGNQRFEGRNDVVFNAYVNNPLEDLESPVYEKGSLRYELTDSVAEGHHVQNLRITFKATDNVGIKNTYCRLMRGNTSYNIDAWGRYDEKSQLAIIDFTIPDFFPSGDYFVSHIIMYDYTGADKWKMFSDSPLDEPRVKINVTTPNPDTEGAEVDLNRMVVYAEPTHPEAPDGETLVTINFYGRDNISGIDHFEYKLLDPQGGEHHNATTSDYKLFFDGDPTLWKHYTLRCILPRGSAPGIWGLSELKLWDKAVNARTYNFVETVIFEPDESTADYVLFSELTDEGILNLGLSTDTCAIYGFTYRIIQEETGQEISGDSNKAASKRLLSRASGKWDVNVDVSSLPDGDLIVIVNVLGEDGQVSAVRVNRMKKTTAHRELPRFFRMKGSQNTYLQAGEASSRPNLGESTDANSIMLLTDEGHIVSYAKGLPLHASDAQNDCNYVAVGGKGAVFYLNETADNKYTVTTKNTSNITALYGGDTQLDKGNFANVESLTDANYHWTIETIETLPVQVSAAGWATLCVPVALTVPTDVKGLKVYTGTKGENTITLTEVTGTIPAGEPVVICAPEGTHQFTISTDETAKSADNCFAGTTEARTVDASSVLTLQIVDDAIGMYTFTGTALRGFCAYMEKSASAAGMKFDFGQSTGIESLIDATTGDKAIYDLSGRRVNHTAKGIYLIGGKKVVIK